jgi:hypothetical protein
VHLVPRALDQAGAVAEHAALELQRVVDLVHELAVVHQQGGVDAGAAARGPARLGLLGVGLQLVHLVLRDLQLALHLTQHAQGLVAALFGQFHHLVQRLYRGHPAFPS